MRLHKAAQGVPYADDWLRDAVVDLAYRPGTDELFVATEDERLGVARVSEADAETDTLRFRWFGASDRFRRELQAGLGKDWIGRWFIDEVPLGINSISFSPDGRWLAAAHADHRVRIFDADRRRQTRCLEGFPAGTWLRFSDSGRFLLSLGYRPRRSPFRWHRRRKGLFGDVQLSALIRTDDWQAVQLASADWPHRPWLGRDLCVRLRGDDRWMFRAKEEEAFILSLANGAYHVVPHAGVRFAEFMPRARGLVTVGLDNVVRGWTWSDDEPDALIAKLDGDANVAEQCFAVQPPAPVTALCLLPNGKWLFVGTEAGVRTAFCDVFGGDETLLAYLHNASDGSNLPFPG
jgi:WD40 repeat protein